MAKRIVQEVDGSKRQSELKSLEKQGHMMREVIPDGAYIWSKAVQTLSAEQMKFALNAAVNMLPHNANLHLRKKKPNDSCPFC